ncbi:MAG: 4Fe-4S dicluster domain-containing protein [Candidatus Thorarchaeota archaeon]|jgi:heterodisulfide reductase subunit C
MEHTNDDKGYTADFPIQDKDVDREFKYDVAKMVGGEGLLQCLKCGACSGGCPVSAVIDYRPRKVLGNVLLGLKDIVLSGDDIWRCAACFTCEERCVQQVNFTDVVTVLRNLAVLEGNASPGYIELAKMVMQHGRVSPRTRQADKIRESLGLPPLQDPEKTQLDSIIQASGFEDIIKAAEGGDEQ